MLLNWISPLSLFVSPTDQQPENPPQADKPKEMVVKETLDEDEPGSGHFMGYFLTMIVLVVAGYLLYHNKQKVRVWHKQQCMTLTQTEGKCVALTQTEGKCVTLTQTEGKCVALT